MWELDHKEGWAPNNWCFQIVVLEKTLKNPLDSRVIKPINLKGNQPENSLEGLMLKRQYYFLPHAKSRLIGKDPDAGKDWGQEGKGTTEDEIVEGITDSMDISLSKLREIVKDGETWLLQFIGLQRVRQDLVTEQQQDLETTKMVGIGQ